MKIKHLPLKFLFFFGPYFGLLFLYYNLFNLHIDMTFSLIVVHLNIFISYKSTLSIEKNRNT